MRDQEFDTLITTLYQRERPRMIGWLARSFPQMASTEVEDAVAAAFCASLASPPAHIDDVGALGRFVRTVAWRELRGTWRKQRNAPTAATLPTPANTDEEARLQARDLLDRLDALIEPAAERHGGRQKTAVAAALRARLTGLSDVEASARHGVRRESVNRARRWMMTETLGPRRAQA